jgi:hypothetical protein
MEPTGPEHEIRSAAAALARLRGRPCLLCVSDELQPRPIAEALAEHRGDGLDIILASNGGDGCVAYAIITILRRRFAHLAAYVPLVAKSAATLLCLGADELVLSDFGELGPLDPQLEQKQSADHPRRRSCLESAKAVEQLRRGALATFDDAFRLVSEKTGMRPLDACGIAVDLTSRLYAPLYAQVDPETLGRDAREADLAAEYAERVLRRYRPAVWAANGPAIVERLVRAYPAHCFFIDREELADLGLPVRAPEGGEAEPIERITMAVMRFEGMIVELIRPGDGGEAERREGPAVEEQVP